MQRRIEALAERLDLSNSELRQGMLEEAFSRADPFDERRILDRFGTLGGSERAFEIVGDHQNLARKVRDCVLPRFLGRAFRSAPRILRIRKRAQQAVAQRFVLSCKGCGIHRFRGDRFVHVSVRHDRLVGVSSPLRADILRP